MSASDVLLLCPAGFESLVASAAASELSEFRQERLLPGYVRVATTTSPEVLRHLPYATNVFIVLEAARRSEPEAELTTLRTGLRGLRRPEAVPRRGTFRMRLFDDGQFSSTAGDAADHVVEEIAVWSGLRFERRGGGTEFWVLRRRECETLLCLRLPRSRTEIPRGSLRPEIAAALVRAVPPAYRRAVLDPFAGTGAIGVAALGAGAGQVWLSDSAAEAFSLLDSLPSAQRARVHTTHADIAALSPSDGPAVTAIVTDPPWGHFTESSEPLDLLYARLGSAAASMLRPGAPLIVLTAAPASAEAAMTRGGRIHIEDSTPVLVNGHKARVLRATRAAGT